MHKISIKRHPLLIPASIFCLLIVYIIIYDNIPHSFPKNHITNFADYKTKFKIIGIVESRPKASSKRIKFVLDTKQLDNAGNYFDVSGKINVSIYNRWPDIAQGDEIAFTGKLFPIRNFGNPGRFNYKRYTSSNGIYASSYTSKGAKILKKSDLPLSFRQKLSDFIDTLPAAIEAKGILKALVIGDKSLITDDLRDFFNRAGAGHLLAISGLHIGIVAGFSFFIFRFLLSRFEFLLLNALVKKLAAILCIIPTVCYGLIAGMSASTFRAVIMVSIFMLGFLFEEESSSLNSLIIAAIIIAFSNNLSVFTVSFQLSFAAVFFIIYGFPKFSMKRRETFFKRLLIGVFNLFLVSCLATVGTLPIVMYYFNQVSFIGPLANLILVPFVGSVLVPASLISSFIYALIGDLAAPLFNICLYIADISIHIIKFFASFKFAAAHTITPSFFEIFCYYLFLIAGIRLFYADLKIKKYCIITLIIALSLIGADVLYWSFQRFWNNELRVTAIDVGQGTANLLEMPKGKVFLIDGGGFSDSSTLDTGKSIIAPLLWQKKIMTVDTIILSHPDSDHLNGLLYIAENFNVKNFWSNNQISGSFKYRAIMRIIKQKGIAKPYFNSMERVCNINGTVLEIIHPKRYFDYKKDKNENSLVLKVSLGNCSFLFPGDIGSVSEKEIVKEKGAALKSDVLMVPHHGSNNSSCKEFIDMVNPKWAVFSLGYRKGLSSSFSKVVKRYKQKGCKILRTDIDGAAEFATDGKKLTLFLPFPTSD